MGRGGVSFILVCGEGGRVEGKRREEEEEGERQHLRLIDNHRHPALAMLGLSAENPYRLRVVHRDLEHVRLPNKSALCSSLLILP